MIHQVGPDSVNLDLDGMKWIVYWCQGNDIEAVGFKDGILHVGFFVADDVTCVLSESVDVELFYIEEFYKTVPVKPEIMSKVSALLLKAWHNGELGQEDILGIEITPEICPKHEYEYDSWERKVCCVHCGQEQEPDRG